MTFEFKKFEEYAEALKIINDEDMRFEYIIDIGKKSENNNFPEEEKVDSNLMHGCMSKVWIVGEIQNKQLYFRGFSDAIIVRGLVAMMTTSFSGLGNSDLQSLTIEKVKKLNLGALTTQRQVGMLAMLEFLQKLGQKLSGKQRDIDNSSKVLDSEETEEPQKAGTNPDEDFKAMAGVRLPEGETIATEEAVIEAIRTVYDPEIPVNIYDMGLILKLEIQETGNVSIGMTLTSPGCPVAGELPVWVAEAVEKVPGTGEVEVGLVWDPPWSPDLMSEDAKLALGM